MESYLYRFLVLLTIILSQAPNHLFKYITSIVVMRFLIGNQSVIQMILIPLFTTLGTPSQQS